MAGVFGLTTFNAGVITALNVLKDRREEDERKRATSFREQIQQQQLDLQVENARRSERQFNRRFTLDEQRIAEANRDDERDFKEKQKLNDRRFSLDRRNAARLDANSATSRRLTEAQINNAEFDLKQKQNRTKVLNNYRQAMIAADRETKKVEQIRKIGTFLDSENPKNGINKFNRAAKMAGYPVEIITQSDGSYTANRYDPNNPEIPLSVDEYATFQDLQKGIGGELIDESARMMLSIEDQTAEMQAELAGLENIKDLNLGTNLGGVKFKQRDVVVEHKGDVVPATRLANGSILAHTKEGSVKMPSGTTYAKDATELSRMLHDETPTQRAKRRNALKEAKISLKSMKGLLEDTKELNIRSDGGFNTLAASAAKFIRNTQAHVDSTVDLIFNEEGKGAVDAVLNGSGPIKFTGVDGSEQILDLSQASVEYKNLAHAFIVLSFQAESNELSRVSDLEYLRKLQSLGGDNADPELIMAGMRREIKTIQRQLDNQVTSFREGKKITTPSEDDEANLEKNKPEFPDTLSGHIDRIKAANPGNVDRIDEAKLKRYFSETLNIPPNNPDFEERFIDWLKTQ